MHWEDGPLRIGTCSWTAKGWAGTFYESGTPQNEFIAAYAQRYSTVEIDATFYATPKAEVVQRWHDITPDGFVFAAKAPKLITHDKFMIDCSGDLLDYLKAMDHLGDKLGPVLFQFPYYAKKTGVTLQDFLDRLAAFLPFLPENQHPFALEVRNKNWICPPLLDLLANHNVTLALIDHPWMARPDQLFNKSDIQTGRFHYLRWLGDRYGIEKITTTWNEVVVDRDKALDGWIPHIKDALDKKLQVFGYVNNHYSGYAPENVDYLLDHLPADSTPHKAK
jgi:uncharacterized protein YecE (DUF72 family)